MTAQQMQYYFELKLGQESGIVKSFKSYDVSMLLTDAQKDLVEGFYSERINPRSRYFEMDERARSMLAYLVENYTVDSGSMVSNDSALHDNGLFITLPSNFLYALKEEVTIEYTDCNGSTVSKSSRVLPITHDEYNMNINNVYKRPYRDLVWRMDFKGTEGKKKHELIHSSDTTITYYKLRYLRRPVDINIIGGVDCELNEMLHQEVVNRAVLAAINTGKIQTKVEQNTES